MTRMGRPSEYTPEIAELIFDYIERGCSLRFACKDDRLPDERTVYRWLRNHEDFRQKYTQAREAQAEGYADRIAEIAEKTLRSEAPDRASIGRLEMDALKWSASKLAPKKYGDRLTTDNNTTLDVSDPVKKLLQEISSSGNRIYDRKPKPE